MDLNNTCFNVTREQIGKPFVIKTFATFCLFSKVDNIFITNIKKKTGFVKLASGRWFRLMSCFHRKWNKRGKYLDNILNDVEVIEAEKYKNRNFMYQHGETGKFHTKNGYFMDLTNKQREEYVLTEIVFDFDKIEKDCLETRFTPRSTLDIRKLDYHEFVVRRNMGNNVHKLQILDCKTFIFKPIDCYDEQFEILCDYHVTTTEFYAKETIDTLLVDSLMCSLIPNKNKLLDFRKLCYNIFVERDVGTETRIFYDYHRDNCHLTIMLCNIFHQLYEKPPLESNDFFIKNVWRTKLTANIRFAIIRENKRYSIDKMIHEFKKFGVRNIIVCVKNDRLNIYREMPFLRLLETNCKKIKKLFNAPNPCSCSCSCPDCTKIKRSFEEFGGEIQKSIRDGYINPSTSMLYFMPEMMFINFFKYVVTKVW